MKLIAKHVEGPFLREGDTVEFSVTHQIRINGDDSWIKYGIGHKLIDGETEEEAAQKAVDHVDAFVIKACQQVAQTVEGFQ